MDQNKQQPQLDQVLEALTTNSPASVAESLQITDHDALDLLSSLAKDHSLIVYYRQGRRNPCYKVEVRKSTDLVTAKGDSFAVTAIEAINKARISYLKAS